MKESNNQDFDVGQADAMSIAVASTNADDHTSSRDEHGSTSDNSESKKPSCLRKVSKAFCSFCCIYEFPLTIISAILLARAYPPLGALYLAPDITSSYIAVMIIFLLSGVGLKTSDLANSSKRVVFNGYVQIFNFLFVSAVAFGLSRLLAVTHVLDEALADGMVICACVPMAISTVVVLTVSAGGDEATAVFNTTFGNIVGIFISPILILMYIGTTANESLGSVFMKLAIRVIAPLVVGQLIQKISKNCREFYVNHKKFFKKVQEYSLVFIVYTLFCETFLAKSGVAIGNVFLMIVFQFILMMGMFTCAWFSLKILFRDQPELRIMGFFGCVLKTVALGIPLIASMYEGSSKMGLYTLPLLIWHPMQLIMGSLFVPKLAIFLASEHVRLDCKVRDETVSVDVECPADKVAQSSLQGNNIADCINRQR